VRSITSTSLPSLQHGDCKEGTYTTNCKNYSHTSSVYSELNKYIDCIHNLALYLQRILTNLQDNAALATETPGIRHLFSYFGDLRVLAITIGSVSQI